VVKLLRQIIQKVTVSNLQSQGANASSARHSAPQGWVHVAKLTANLTATAANNGGFGRTAYEEMTQKPEPFIEM
jgi:hypothetical protein